MPQIPVRTGVTVNYEITGSGEPLLLVMGTSGAIPLWGEMIARLSETNQVIAYDNRGLGGSDRGTGPITVASLAEDASALLEALEVLAAAESADDGVIEDADVGDVIRPRRQGAGRGLVVGVARCPSGCRSCGDHSAVTSATAARVEDSSTMALSAANAATRAWRAMLLTARG